MSDSIDKILGIIDDRCNKNIDNKSNNYIKTRIARVIEYEPENYKTYVIFPDDDAENIHLYYNKTNEYLQTNDYVRVFYTTNIDKGWIGLRSGDVQIKKEEIIPYISSKIFNLEKSELSVLDTTVALIDFTVKGTDSDVVLNANQRLQLEDSGTVNFKYFVDGVEQDYIARQNMNLGENIFTHVVPMRLNVGDHKIQIDMNSAETTGTTAINDLYGVLSGQIENLNMVLPPNTKFIFKLKGVEAGTEINVFPFNSPFNSTGTQGVVNWGDGSDSETFLSNSKEIKHTYDVSGDYDILISVGISEVKLSWNSTSIPNPNWENTISEFIMPDNITHFELPSDAFEGSSIKNVVVSKNLKSFKTSFKNSQLAHINLPEGLTELRASAIAGDGIGVLGSTQLTSITTPSTLQINNEDDGYGWFRNCSQLTTAIVNSSIGRLMFYKCPLLSNVTINNTCTLIGRYAFGYCTSLKEIKIPNSVLTMGDGVFYNCSSLQKVTLSNQITSITTECFQSCSSLENVNLSNITKISDYAFRYAIKTGTVITFPSTLKEIGHDAFLESGIGEFNGNPNIESVGADAFRRSSITKAHCYPSQYGDNCFRGCNNLTSVILENDCELSKYMFAACSNLSSVDLGNATYIPDSAFNNCPSLESINFYPNTVIGNSAFVKSGLTSLSTGNIATTDYDEYRGYLSVANNAFYDCNKIEEIDGKHYKFSYYEYEVHKERDENNKVISERRTCKGIAKYSHNGKTYEAYGIYNALSIKDAGGIFRDCKFKGEKNLDKNDLTSPSFDTYYQYLVVKTDVDPKSYEYYKTYD